MPGPQYTLDHDGVHLEIAALAAAIRSLSVDGVQLTEPYGADRVAPMGCGMVLVPWPNRVRDGVWMLAGEPQLLDITEPALHNASHGLLRNTGYRLVTQTENSLTLAAVVAPQHGWPFLFDTRVHYELGADGLTVRHEITNLSSSAAPLAVGAHPYLRVGDVPSEQLTVTLTGAVRLELDDRFNPVATRPVDEPGDASFDLRGGRPAGDLDLNTAYGELSNADGRADIAWLTAPDGRRTTLWADPDFGWIQAYTPSNFPRDEGPGFAIALEPMTGPPDALNSGVGLLHLEAGASWSGEWGIRYTAATATATATGATS